jgi:hypothetical protein
MVGSLNYTRQQNYTLHIKLNLEDVSVMILNLIQGNVVSVLG